MGSACFVSPSGAERYKESLPRKYFRNICFILCIICYSLGYKLILRSVSGTETREVTEPEETEDWANLVFGSLSLDQFSQVY